MREGSGPLVEDLGSADLHGEQDWIEYGVAHGWSLLNVYAATPSWVRRAPTRDRHLTHEKRGAPRKGAPLVRER